MEGELQELRRGNERLKSTVRELAARDTITTSSIGKQSTGATTQLRNSGISSSSTVAVAQRPGRLGIHLATFADPATLGVAWKSLKAGEEAMLSRLTPYARAIVSSSGEKLYRLIAGPIGSQTEAMTLCRQMKARNRFCRVSAKLGTPLAQVLARN